MVARVAHNHKVAGSSPAPAKDLMLSLEIHFSPIYKIAPKITKAFDLMAAELRPIAPL